MKKSVLQDWVMELPIMMQALLCTAMRGPDTLSKNNAAKKIIRFLRGAILNPADPNYSGNDDSFMWTDYNKEEFLGFIAQAVGMKTTYWANAIQEFLDDPDIYPHHFIMHLIHAAEVVGYKHPDFEIRRHWEGFYELACEALHMNPEDPEHMDERLTFVPAFKPSA